MKIENFQYHINYRDVWEEMRRERRKKLEIIYDLDFFQKFTTDFSKQIKFGDYEFGRKVTEILKEILDGNFEILEIGPGPGTLTILLSKMVKKIIGIELSEVNIKHLKENLKQNNLKNVEIVNEDWEKVDNKEIEAKFNLVVCSHFLWQTEDIEILLKRMEKAAKKYCVIIQPCGRGERVKEVFKEICNQKYKGQFGPDADYFVYLILREWGRIINVRHFDYTFTRNLEEEIRYIASFIGRFIEVNQSVEEKIRDYLLKKSENGNYREKKQAVVMWWEVKK